MISKKEIYEAAYFKMLEEWGEHCDAGREREAEAVADKMTAIEQILIMLGYTGGEMKKYKYSNTDTGSVIYADSGDEFDAITAGDKSWDGVVVRITNMETGESDLAWPIVFAGKK
jgi:hypothetical protein